MLGLRIDVVELAAHDQRCHERLIGSPAGMSLNPAKFQFPLAQNRGALQCVTDSTKIWRKIRVSGHGALTVSRSTPAVGSRKTADFPVLLY